MGQEKRKSKRKKALAGARKKDQPDLDWEVYDRVLEESPLKSNAAKEELAFDYISLGAVVKTLGRLVGKDEASTDDYRCLNAATSNRRRIAESLGLIEHDDDDGEEL